MSLLDQLEPAHRTLLEGVATEIMLNRGAYLLRRGEAGGDFFVIEEGQIEILDSRTTPETILAVLATGATFGEVSFIDDSPRSADARARGPTRVRRWTKEDVRALLRREPALGSRFYECIARVTTGHLRNQTQATHANREHSEGATLAGIKRVRADVTAFASAMKSTLVTAETALRQDPTASTAHDTIERALNGIQSWVADHFAAHPELELAAESTRLLTGELHPYLVRSALAELCIRRAQGGASVTELLVHILSDDPTGDGRLGTLVDRWLLNRPTFRALRATRAQLMPLVTDALSSQQLCHVAIFNAGAGALVQDIAAAAGDMPTTLTVLDPSRDALAQAVARASQTEQNLTLSPVQLNMIDAAAGRWRPQLPPQHLIVVHDLIDYLPDRLVLGLLHQLASILAPDGTLLLAALAPSPDRVLLDRLLAWPTVRRHPDRIARLFRRAGLSGALRSDMEDPLMVFSATHSPTS